MLTVVRSVQEPAIVGEDDDPQHVLNARILTIHVHRVRHGLEVESETSVQRSVIAERFYDGADSLNAQSSIRSAFISWLNRRVQPGGKVEVLDPQEEVATYV